MAGFDQAAYDLALRVECQSDLYFFTKRMFKARKKYKWRDNWHHAKICRALESVYHGHTRRLIINIAPRFSKTELAVVNFVAWSLGKNPDSEFIHTSYSSRLAANNSFLIKGLIETPEYRSIFPDVQLAQDSKAKDEWRTTAGGVMYSTGSNGAITGFGAGKLREGFGGAIILDDPHKSGEADSDTMRNNVIETFSNTIESRTNTPNTPIIVIMQRLHEKDLSGFLLGGGNGEHWTHLNIPAIGTNEAGEDEALWPEKLSLEKLREMERARPYVFAGQYQQRPAPLGGGIFKTAWWNYYDPNVKPSFTRIIQSWDTAFKTKEKNDYSVCTTWGETPTAYYLLDIWKDKLEFPALRRQIEAQAARWMPHAVLIEDKASGQSLIQTLKSETRLPVIAVPKNIDKVACANLATPVIEAGRVYLPKGHPEVERYVLSHAQFPNGANDDDVDSTTQALNFMSRGQAMEKIAIGGM